MIIAIVNDYKIEQNEYEAELQNVLHQMRLEEPNQEARRRAIEQLIDAYLLLEEAKAEEIEIAETEVEDAIVELMLKFNSKQEFDAMLQQNDLNYDMLRNRIQNDLLIKKFVQSNFLPPKKIPLQKLNDIYNENKESFVTQEMIKASHILIKGDDDDECLRQIEKISKEISSPDEFLTKAQEFSDCPSCCTYGDLGYFSRGKMVKAFDDVAFKLDINEISQPVKTQFGYHLIMVTDRKESKIAEFEEVKEALVQRLKQIDCELQMIRHIKKLRCEADIMINFKNL